MGQHQGQTPVRYILYLVVAILAFSSFETVSKPTAAFISPAQLTFYRFLIGGCMLLPFARRQQKQQNIRLGAKDYLKFAGLGFCLVCVSLNLAQYGITYANASMSAVIFSANPLFTTLFAALILKEAISWRKLLGLGIGIVGLITTCLHLFGQERADGRFLFGIVLIVTGMLAFALYTVCSKAVSGTCGSIVTITWSSILGALLMIPILLSGNGNNPFAFQLSAIVPEFLYLCLIGTALAYYCYFDAIAHVSTGLGSMSFFIKPGLASLLCAVVLGEPITANIIIGIILILCGLAVSLRTGKQKT
ncbi:MAG: DMT family transporter [Clostridiales bacterium]|nr:DMT family transporter [Clostridiales bacterium]